MAINNLDELHVADCMTIIKAFERGATFSNTPEAAYALMTPPLNDARTQSTGLLDQMENDDNQRNKRQQKPKDPDSIEDGSTLQEAADLSGIDKKDSKDKGIIDSFKDKLKDENLVDLLFNNECIPCLDRINFKNELDFKAGLKTYFKLWYGWLQQHLQQILNMLDLLKWENQTIDLCAFISFFKNFVCVPDIARIISVLMALLSRVNFTFNGLFDLVLSLFGPLLQPFFSNFIDLMIKYLMLIVAPIECIINAIQAMLAKLDYNSFFGAIDNLEWHLSIGPNTGAQINNTPIFGVPLHQGPRTLDVKGQQLPIGKTIVAQKMENQKAVDQAAIELRKIQNTKISSTDISTIKNHQEKLNAAKEKYEDAIDKRDLSQIGRANKEITEFTSQAKSTLMMLIGMLRSAIDALETFFKNLFDEFQKIMNEYLGGSGNYMKLIADKLAIAQMLAFITAIVKAILEADLHCNDDKEIKIEIILTPTANTFIWTDEEGNTHIEEDEEAVNNAINAVIDSIGQEPRNTLGKTNNPYGKNPSTNTVGSVQGIPVNNSDKTGKLNNNLRNNNFGNNNLGLVNTPNNQNINSNTNNAIRNSVNSIGNNNANDALLRDQGQKPLSYKQRQKSLIKYTGDPVVDSNIARGINELTTPVKVSFKCPLKTTVADAEQVNKWIRELNTI
jgi:hypothetical protein